MKRFASILFDGLRYFGWRVPPAEDRLAFDGKYSDRLSKVDGTRCLYPAGAQCIAVDHRLPRSRDAIEATVFVWTNYGSSEYQWVVGPAPAENLRLVDDALTYSGGLPFLIVCATYRGKWGSI